MMRRALAAVVALLVVATPALAAPGMELAVQDDAALVRDPWANQGRGAPRPSSARALDVARSIRASVVRFNVRWDKVGPLTGAADLRRLDRAVDRVRRRGMRVQLTLTGPAPPGATESGAAGIEAPRPDAYAAFAERMARHFAGRVRRFALWNEPNWPTHLQPTSRAPAIYRALYDAAEPAVRRGTPGAQVLFGELAPMGAPEAAIPPLRFVRAAFACRACPPVRADGIALHPYTLRWAPAFPGPTRDDVTIGSLDRMTRLADALTARGALRRPGGGHQPLYLTEFGFHAQSRRIPEPLRARYAHVAAGIALRHPRVRQLLWYQLAPPPPAHDIRQWDTALVGQTGRARPTLRVL